MAGASDSPDPSNSSPSYYYYDYDCRIVRAFLIEEQKIVKKVLQDKARRKTKA